MPLQTHVDTLKGKKKGEVKVCFRLHTFLPREIDCLSNRAIKKSEARERRNDARISNLFVFSFRSSLTIVVEDVNEYAPVFTHNQYLFKLHQDQTCESSSCRVREEVFRGFCVEREANETALLFAVIISTIACKLRFSDECQQRENWINHLQNMSHSSSD